MTVSNTAVSSGPYTPNGVTTTFAYTFRIEAADEITVARRDSVGVETVIATGYSVTGAGSDSGGNIVFDVAPAAGDPIYAYADTAFTQEVDLVNQGSYSPTSVEEALDRALLRDNLQQEQLDRAIKVRRGTTPFVVDDYDDLVDAAAAAIGSAAVDLVTAEGVAQVALVEAEGATQVGLVEAEGATQVGLVEDAGAAQVVLVEAEGTAQLALIAAANAGDLYADTAAGLAAAASGSHFATPGTDGAVLNYYLDNAGVAVLVAQVWGSNAADPQVLHLARARFDTQVEQGLRDYPELLPVMMFQGTFGGGAADNGDGTWNFPVGGTWVSANLSVSPFTVPGDLYAYLVQTGFDTGIFTIRIHQAGTTIKAGNTVTEPHYGVTRQTWNNAASLTHVTISIENVGAVAVDTYKLEVYASDSDYLPQVINLSEVVNVPEWRTEVDWDLEYSPAARRQIDAFARARDEANINAAFDSVAGSDAAAGTRFAPKQTLAAGSTLTEGQVVGFRYGAEWAENYPDLGSTTKGLVLRGYRDGQGIEVPYPVIYGSIDITGYTWTADSGIWYTDVAVDADVLNDSYSAITVVFSEDAVAALTPREAETMGAVKTSKAACIAAVRSSYTTLAASVARVWVNPPDGLEPGTGGYSLRVTNRFCPFNWNADQNRMAVMSMMEVKHANFGYGCVSGGVRSAFDHLIIGHGGTHAIKMGGGRVQDTIVYDRGTFGNSCNCYISDGAGHSWIWTRLQTFDCPSPYYSHVGAGGAYERGEYSYLMDHNARSATGALADGDAFTADSVNELEIKYCYTSGRERDSRAGTYVVPVPAWKHHMLSKDIGIHYSAKLTQHGYHRLTNRSHPTDVNRRFMIGCRVSEDHIVEKQLFHFVNDDVSASSATGDYNPTLIDVVIAGMNNPNIRKCVFVVECTLATACTIISETGATTYQSNDNVFVFFIQGSIASYKFGTATYTTVARYLSQFTGHDTTSVFLDERDNALKAANLFRDAPNGDYRIAQTRLGAKFRAACLALDAGPEFVPVRWPERPTIDAACDELMMAA